MKVDRNTIKSWFQTHKEPTEEQFANTWDSFWHKDDNIPIGSVENLSAVVELLEQAAGNAKVLYVESDSGYDVLPEVQKPKPGDIVLKHLIKTQDLEVWVFDESDEKFVLKTRLKEAPKSHIENTTDTLDWNYMGGMATTTAEDVELSFKNLRTGTYFLQASGNINFIFPQGFEYVGGEKSDSEETTYYQIVCLDVEHQKGIYSIYKEEGL